MIWDIYLSASCLGADIADWPPFRRTRCPPRVEDITSFMSLAPFLHSASIRSPCSLGSLEVEGTADKFRWFSM